MSDAPDAFIDEKLSQILGLEIEIIETRAKSKLSQNKPDADRLGAADGRGANPIADRIRDV
jgi:transcriptional regulator